MRAGPFHSWATMNGGGRVVVGIRPERLDQEEEPGLSALRG
jgi:hypothetical protein